MELVASIEVENTLGEGIVWDVATQSAWWTDIEERWLYRYEWASRKLEKFVTPERLCSFGFVAGASCLIAAFETRFALYDPRSGALKSLGRPDGIRPGIRLNDGRVDRQGRFWAGGMAENKALAGEAHLYCLDRDGRIHCRESEITTSNSICWSPDAAWFYFADSPARTIWRYAFDAANGSISSRTVFIQTEEGAEPDGTAVDAEGFIWNAQWGAGRVVRYAPDGSIDRVLEVPVSHPTCVAFGGPKLDLLFVTSARRPLSAATLAGQPNAGNVLVYKSGTAGLPEHRYRFSEVSVLDCLSGDGNSGTHG